MPIIILMSIDYTYVAICINYQTSMFYHYLGNDDRNMKLAFALSLKFGKTLSRELQV